MALTLFSSIESYLNIADTTGKESLFQAEMHRIKKLLKKIKQLSQDEFCFVMLDEIFTGTNPTEAKAGAYAVAKKLSSFDNVTSIFATHFMLMTNLTQDTNDKFENYKVYINKKEDGTINYPYKLEKGIANQTIALDLLSEEGFDDDILNDAYKILKKQQSLSGA